MRRSELQRNHGYGLIEENNVIIPPRQQEVQDRLKPENDVISQYGPEALMKIAQKRLKWGSDAESQRKLSRERQLANDEVAIAQERSQAQQREAEVQGSRRGDHAGQRFSVGRTTPLEVAPNGNVISPMRDNQSTNRSGVKERSGAPDLDAASKMTQRRELPVAGNIPEAITTTKKVKVPID